jgi:leucyl aminopeptidase (aminopeptidase T)
MFKFGIVTSVEGSTQTSQSRERMVDIENVGNMPEFAIGPNPVAHLFGNLQ